jgi:hypothetical protein
MKYNGQGKEKPFPKPSFNIKEIPWDLFVYYFFIEIPWYLFVYYFFIKMPWDLFVYYFFIGVFYKTHFI